VQANAAGVISTSFPSISTNGTYKHQTVGTRIHFGILSNVPIWHPWTHDIEWKRSIRNPDDGENVWMRIGLALLDHTMVYLE